MTTGNEKEVTAMEKGGNKRVNAILEAKWMGGNTKLTVKSSMAERQTFCREKYSELKYGDTSVYTNIADIKDAEPVPKPDPPVNIKNKGGKSRGARPRFDRQMSVPVMCSPKFGDKPRFRDSDLGKSMQIFEDILNSPEHAKTKIRLSENLDANFPSMSGAGVSQRQDNAESDQAWDDIGSQQQWDPFLSDEGGFDQRASSQEMSSTWHPTQQRTTISTFIESQSSSDGSIDFDEFSEVKWDDTDSFGKKNIDKLKQGRKHAGAAEHKPSLPVSHEEGEDDDEEDAKLITEQKKPSRDVTRRLNQSDGDFNLFDYREEDALAESTEAASQQSKGAVVQSKSKYRGSRRPGTSRRSGLQKTMSVPALHVEDFNREEVSINSKSSRHRRIPSKDAGAKEPPGKKLSDPIGMAGKGAASDSLDNKSEHSKGRRRMLRKDRQSSDEVRSSSVSRRSHSSGRTSRSERSESRDPKRPPPRSNRSSSKDSGRSDRRSRTPTAMRRQASSQNLGSSSDHRRRRSTSRSSRQRARPRSVEAAAKARERRAAKQRASAAEEAAAQSDPAVAADPVDVEDSRTSQETQDDSSPSNSESCDAVDPDASFNPDESAILPVFLDTMENVLGALDVSA